MKRCEVTVDGKRLVVWAERSGGEIWFHLQGRTLNVNESESFSRKGKGGSATSHPGQIMAPMPGKITQVNVTPGAKVKMGDVLVVMEAMKMEYTLAADLAGKVALVQCKTGEQVSLGQLLVRVEAES